MTVHFIAVQISATTWPKHCQIIAHLFPIYPQNIHWVYSLLKRVFFSHSNRLSACHFWATKSDRRLRLGQIRLGTSKSNFRGQWDSQKCCAVFRPLVKKSLSTSIYLTKTWLYRMRLMPYSHPKRWKTGSAALLCRFRLWWLEEPLKVRHRYFRAIWL